MNMFITVILISLIFTYLYPSMKIMLNKYIKNEKDKKEFIISFLIFLSGMFIGTIISILIK